MKYCIFRSREGLLTNEYTGFAFLSGDVNDGGGYYSDKGLYSLVPRPLFARQIEIWARD